MRTKYLPTILTVCLLATLACAGAIKQWASGETLGSADLNANFSHIHSNMVGGHGARLVDADVNASAAISHSKMATPALLPKAWAMFAATCGGTPCAETVTVASGVTSIQHTAVGAYTVTWTTARADANYAVLVTPITSLRGCNVFVYTTTNCQIACNNTAGAAADTPFNILLMDNL